MSLALQRQSAPEPVVHILPVILRVKPAKGVLKMYERIDEPIDVWAVFSCGRLRPVAFEWQNERKKITKITFSWTEKRGMNRLVFYSVTDSANTYEICYDTQEMLWRLAKVYIPGA